MKKSLLAGITLCVLSACAVSPTGRKQLLLMGNNDVAQMGLSSFQQIKQKERVSTDPKQTRYVQCVAQAITQAIPAQFANTNPGQWEVVVFDSKEVNAFALPGGRIGVYTGLLKVAKNQDQLAAVIGHEVSHVLAQHSNERLSQSQVANMGMAAADQILQNSSTKGPAMAALGIGVQYGVLMPYSRAHETEADVLGLQLMSMAGFNPQEAVSLWYNMAGASQGNEPLEILSTHPSDQTRINQLQSLVPQMQPVYQQAQAGGVHPQCAG
ncbi:M48 family metallopeptidase [uncultured Tolumonas sp.]|uniref:M48 family metallopeptidase n=1 Tax=uncultured Tolumonas sp. TaxID=263765 RepID=UPI00292FF11B|nr:M48 family metallopeptidase [uncultured Tolumonas sp.]